LPIHFKSGLKFQEMGGAIFHLDSLPHFIEEIPWLEEPLPRAFSAVRAGGLACIR
jgi:hypothetical protein